MRTCTKCGETKPETDYYFKDKSSGRLHSQCKLCYKLHRATYYSQHYSKYSESYRKRAKAYRNKVRMEYRTNMEAFMKDKSCSVCSESDSVVLELDHVDPSQKLFSISQAVRLGKKWSDVIIEIEKCQVLCANCHRRKTSKQFGWYKA